MRITVGREVQRPVTLSSRSLESNQGSSRYTVYEERGYERHGRALAARARRRSSSSFFDCQRSDRPLPFWRSGVQIFSRVKKSGNKKAAVVSQGGPHDHVVTWLSCRTIPVAIATEHADERRLQQRAARPSGGGHRDMWFGFAHGMSLDGLYG